MNSAEQTYAEANNFLQRVYGAYLGSTEFAKNEHENALFEAARLLQVLDMLHLAINSQSEEVISYLEFQVKERLAAIKAA